MLNKYKLKILINTGIKGIKDIYIAYKKFNEMVDEINRWKYNA